jgi:hypothetical protein
MGNECIEGWLDGSDKPTGFRFLENTQTAKVGDDLLLGNAARLSIIHQQTQTALLGQGQCFALPAVQVGG